MRMTYVGDGDAELDSVLITDILRGEPIFALRARDKQAVPVLRAYQARVQPLFSPERAAGLDRDIAAFERWQAEHAGIVRDPD
mgnify:CR=1 FL=1